MYVYCIPTLCVSVVSTNNRSLLVRCRGYNNLLSIYNEISHCASKAGGSQTRQSAVGLAQAAQEQAPAPRRVRVAGQRAVCHALLVYPQL